MKEYSNLQILSMNHKLQVVNMESALAALVDRH